MSSNGKTAFVTGGTGFIGSHLAESLLQCGYSEVRCLVRSKPKWLSGIDIIPVRATLMDQSAIIEAVSGVDYVYHLGGVTRATNWDALYDGNVLATRNLLNAIELANPSIKKVLITSTLAVIGRVDDATADQIPDESTPRNPVSQYGLSKAVMEDVVWRQFGSKLPITIIRPSSVYGPRDRDIYTFFRTVSRGICPILRGDKGLSLVHASDLVQGIIAAAESKTAAGNTYFLGSRDVVSWAGLRTATLSALQRKAISVYLPRILVRPLGAASQFLGKLAGEYPPLNREKAREILYAAKTCSSVKARQDFGYLEDVTLAEGVAQTIAWYKTEGWL